MFGLLQEVRWRLNPYGVDLESVVIGMEYLSEFYGPHWVGTPEALLTLISKIRPEARLPRTSKQLWRLLEMLAKVVTGRVTIDLDGCADRQALVRLSYVRSKEKREPVLITVV